MVKAPNPHRVSAILALAPKVVAELMYIMIGDAVKAHAQLNRLSFCRLQKQSQQCNRKPKPASAICNVGSVSHLEPCHSLCQRSSIYKDVIRSDNRIVCVAGTLTVHSKLPELLSWRANVERTCT